jgi:hypothetical protein
MRGRGRLIAPAWLLLTSGLCRCAALKLPRVHFFHGDAFMIDIDKCPTLHFHKSALSASLCGRSMQYDCVYIGAGATDAAKSLFKLVKPGGIVVGPFSIDEGGQSLKKARRVGDKEFAVWDILPVCFEPLRVGEGPAHGRRLVLQASCWTPNVHHSFPLPFKCGVRTILMACKHHDSIVSSLPKEIWFRIFAFMDREWLSPPRPGQLCGSCQTSSTNAHCGRCKIVRYCSKECQRKHWKEHKLTCKPYATETPSALNTPRLQAATPHQHTAYGTPNVSPFMQPAAAPSPFEPTFHMGGWDLDGQEVPAVRPCCLVIGGA